MLKADHTKTLKLYEWAAVKDKLHRDARMPFFTEGQVWWCAWGENIDSELNGKGPTFARPVIIIKKWNAHTFIAVPLTSRVQSGPRFVNFYFHNILETAVLSQSKNASVYRLYSKIGQVPSNTLELITEQFKRVI